MTAATRLLNNDAAAKIARAAKERKPEAKKKARDAALKETQRALRLNEIEKKRLDKLKRQQTTDFSQ